MEKYRFDYSEYSDILNIHKHGEITKGSVELGDFTLDFGKNNEVIGIEIEHASEFFKNVDIDKNLLNEINEASLMIDKRNPSCEIVILSLRFQTNIKKIPIPLTVVA